VPSAKGAGGTQTKSVPVKPYRILVVDDHAVVRHGLRTLLESQPGIEVCDEACNGVEALELVKKIKPDLMIVDLTMPEMNGLELTCATRKESPSTEILVLTMHFSDELAREVLRAGALGYVLKSDADSDLLAAVDHVRHHQPFFTSQLAVTMAEKFVLGPGESGAVGENGQPGSPLTPRETEVVRLLADGKSNKEVAAELGVSTRTIESHRNHIMSKLKFRSFSELVRFAVRTSLVAP
jgi:DNA-binding NarL/FixJ family response regulator